jgi:lipoprotein-anchoring transpeptidase ErfK/SrfK
MAGGQTAAPAPDAPPSPALFANPAPALAEPTATSIPSPTMDIINSAEVTDTGVNDGISPAIVRAEVMLDRVHASPGVIDGRVGENFVHALETYEKAKGLRATKGLGDKVWASLLAESGGPVLMEYVLTEQDVEGPFFPNLPKDYGELAKLKTIGYRNPSQKIGAMFHMGEDLLATLNPGVDLSKAGTKILVAEVKRQPIHGTLKTIVVDKKKSQVLGYDRKGHVLVAFPATIGSRELPSPSGTYKVKGVAYNPIYYYDPDNFVQGHNKEKLRLPPGPNNPVGSVFIALTKPTYGLHGTPDPSKIDKSTSHGCVRMTNWDANELAHLVKRGIVVRFKS